MIAGIASESAQPLWLCIGSAGQSIDPSGKKKPVLQSKVRAPDGVVSARRAIGK